MWSAGEAGNELLLGSSLGFQLEMVPVNFLRVLRFIIC